MDHFWALRLPFEFSKTFRFYCSLLSLSTDVCVYGNGVALLGCVIFGPALSLNKHGQNIPNVQEILPPMIIRCIHVNHNAAGSSIISTPRAITIWTKPHGHVRYPTTAHRMAFFQEQFTSSRHRDRIIPDVRHSITWRERSVCNGFGGGMGEADPVIWCGTGGFGLCLFVYRFLDRRCRCTAVFPDHLQTSYLYTVCCASCTQSCRGVN